MSNKKNNPLISIITPSLNQGHFIEQTIQSVLHQTYKNIEYIIMDGGSEDNTTDVVEKYIRDPRLRFYSQKDNGQYDAVNRGFTLAAGEILGWINADDLYAHTTLAQISAVFQADPSVDVVYGRLCSFKIQSGVRRIMFCRNFSYKWLRRYCFTNPSVTFIHNSVIHRDHLFIDTSVPTYGDWDWYLRMAEKEKKFHYVPEILGYFRIHPASRIMRMDRRQSYLEKTIIARRHHLPVHYIVFWGEYIIPWAERFENLYFLVKQGKWQEIACRCASACRFIYKDYIRKFL